jgi:hypothetical protein
MVNGMFAILPHYCQQMRILSDGLRLPKAVLCQVEQLSGCVSAFKAAQ